jgi:hypothetical protein
MPFGEGNWILLYMWVYQQQWTRHNMGEGFQRWHVKEAKADSPKGRVMNCKELNERLWVGSEKKDVVVYKGAEQAKSKKGDLVWSEEKKGHMSKG